jgi:hypothetical protein
MCIKIVRGPLRATARDRPYQTYGRWFIVPGDIGLGMMVTGMRSNKEESVAFAIWLGHGTFVTCQVAPKREERGGQRKVTQQRSLLVLSLSIRRSKRTVKESRSDIHSENSAFPKQASRVACRISEGMSGATTCSINRHSTGRPAGLLPWSRAIPDETMRHWTKDTGKRLPFVGISFCSTTTSFKKWTRKASLWNSPSRARTKPRSL